MKNSFWPPFWPACFTASRSEITDRTASLKAIALPMVLTHVQQRPVQQFSVKAIVSLLLGCFVAAQNAQAFGMGPDHGRNGIWLSYVPGTALIART